MTKKFLTTLLCALMLGSCASHETPKELPPGYVGMDLLYWIKSYERIQNADNPSRTDFDNSKLLMAYIRAYSFCPHLTAPNSPTKGQAGVVILKNYLFKHPDRINEPIELTIVLAFMHHVQFDSADPKLFPKSKNPSIVPKKNGAS